jgi:hypothetical protein
MFRGCSCLGPERLTYFTLPGLPRIEHFAANKRLFAVEHSRHIGKHAQGSAGNPEPDVG